MTKEQIAIVLYGVFDRLWIKSEGVLSKEEADAIRAAAQFFQLEANVVAVVEPAGDAVLIREILSRLSVDQSVVEQQLAEDTRLYGSSWCWLIAGHKIRIPPQEMYFRNAQNR